MRLAAAGIDYLQPSAIKNGLTAMWDICQRAETEGRNLRAARARIGGRVTLRRCMCLAAKEKGGRAGALLLRSRARHMPYGTSVPIRSRRGANLDMPGLGPDPDEKLMRFRV